MGAELRDHRRPPPGLARVQADVQRTVDAGEVRLSESSPSATRFRRAGRGRVEVITFKPLSKNPGALHYAAADDDEPIFVLRANDPLAALLVREWANRYHDEKKPSTLKKADEARACARAMELWLWSRPPYRPPYGP